MNLGSLWAGDVHLPLPQDFSDFLFINIPKRKMSEFNTHCESDEIIKSDDL